MKLSLGQYCLDVKSSGFAVPFVVAKQKSLAYRAVFHALYTLSDEAGEFELKASQLADRLGISRRAVYNAIAFLKRVNLLRCLESRTGRGNHSKYFLNWRKPQSKQREKSHSKRVSSRHGRKCADLSINKNIKTHITYDREFSMGKSKRSQKPQPLWARMMKSFRQLIDQSWLMSREKSICVGVLGRYLKSKSEEFSRALYHQIAGFVHKLDVPSWVESINDLCRWFMGVVKGASKRIELESTHE